MATLVALRKNILIFARNSLCLLNNICSSVLKLCVRSVNVSFFSFDFLINTWYFFISRIHCYHNTCRCMFVCFLFCLFWNFEETREKTFIYIRKVKLMKFQCVVKLCELNHTYHIYKTAFIN